MEPLVEKVFQHGLVTRTVLGCAFEVMRELGAGFVEPVYRNALEIAIRDAGLPVTARHPAEIRFRGERVGVFVADLLVAERVVVELKAVKALQPEHKAEVINHLKASGIEVALLISFGHPRLEYCRLTRDRNIDVQDAQDRMRPSCPTSLAD